jgi:hypothetical protein
MDLRYTRSYVNTVGDWALVGRTSPGGRTKNIMCQRPPV